jgi:hypothetical protein
MLSVLLISHKNVWIGMLALRQWKKEDQNTITFQVAIVVGPYKTFEIKYIRVPFVIKRLELETYLCCVFHYNGTEMHEFICIFHLLGVAVLVSTFSVNPKSSMIEEQIFVILCRVVILWISQCKSHFFVLVAWISF